MSAEPRLSTVEIEAEIEKMKAEGNRTEAWMSARARNKLREFEERDQALRDAFEAGYRMGSDHSFLAPVAGLVAALLVLGAVFLLTENFIFVIPEIPPPAGWAN